MFREQLQPARNSPLPFCPKYGAQCDENCQKTSRMIITRSPLRISLGGGGTDLPSYSRDFGGFVISAAIDKHVYLTIHEPFTEQILLKYSQMEVVQSRSEIKHPVIREALGMFGIETQIEIASMSDIPSGTGLGSS